MSSLVTNVIIAVIFNSLTSASALSQYRSGEGAGIQSHRAPDLIATWSGDPQWLTGRAWTNGPMDGSIGLGKDFFGSSLSHTELTPVEIRFSAADTTFCQTYRRDKGYAAAGVGVFRGSAWDISNPAQPRRLNLLFVEDSTMQKRSNRVWDPDVSGLGGREYLLVMLSDYDGTGLTYAQTPFSPGADVLYAWWPKLDANFSFFASDPASLTIELNHFRNFNALPFADRNVLRWSFDAEGVQTIRVFGDEGVAAQTQIADLPFTTAEFLHKGLKSNTLYAYRLEGLDANGSTLLKSDVISVRTGEMGRNMELLTYWNERKQYGDVWGYVDESGREYALLCVRNEGLSVIDITDHPPVETGFVPAVSDDPDSKDVKVYKHYAILINEHAPVQIIDLKDPSNPRTVATIILDSIAGPGGAHTCAVDGDHLFVMGNHGVGGILIFDLSDPLDPQLTGRYEPYYMHDIYVRNDTAFGFAINGQGVDIIDVSDRSSPRRISNFNYTLSGAHNGRTSKDGSYLFVGDEIGRSGNHTWVFDIRDPHNVRHVADIIVDPKATAHNCYVVGDFIYIAHYTEGVRVWNVVNPERPFEVAHYDTFPPELFGFNGVWSLYPHYPSGKVVASDMQTGLYIFRVDPSALTSTSSLSAPEGYALEQNYPNPFRGVTNVRFTTPHESHVRLTVADARGRTLRTLLRESMPAGTHTVSFDADGLSGGAYLLRLEAGGVRLERRMIFAK